MSKIPTYDELVAQVAHLTEVVALHTDLHLNQARSRKVNDKIRRLKAENAALQDDINRPFWTKPAPASRMTTTTAVRV